MKDGGYSIIDAHKAYKAARKAKGKVCKLRAPDYRKVCLAINYKIITALLEGHNLSLGHNLGFLHIVKHKTNPNRLIIDQNETKKQQQIVFFTNQHSDGHYARFVWEPRTYMLPKSKVYKFRASNLVKNRLTKIMKEKGGHKKYPLV